MKKYIRIWGFLFFLPISLMAQQSVENVLTQIEKNNTALAALRKNADAEKIGNKTGMYLQNPEMEFNYLWGNPSVIGNRTDLNITQTFDFPTAYSYKNQISKLKNDQVELEFQKQKRDLTLQARNLCTDLIYTHALKSETLKRKEQARWMADAYKRRLEMGDATQMEYNTAQRNLLNSSKELEGLEIEYMALQSELTRLNGGVYISFPDSIFPILDVPSDFEQWYALAEQNNPMLTWIKQELAISQKQEKLNRAMSLPKVQTGYMSEKVVGQNFQGITVGLSLPLWENKNQVKFAKAKTLALESIASDNKLQFYTQLKALHGKVVSLQKNVNEYRSNLASFDNSGLVKKAWDKGEISLTDYLLELSLTYESTLKLLEMERNLFKAQAELINYR
ncbi:MAG: TolC family protein [Salinivirgaceae bacterium]|nr:TolC family protein [Salinivirgaceae bacterium]